MALVTISIVCNIVNQKYVILALDFEGRIFIVCISVFFGCWRDWITTRYLARLDHSNKKSVMVHKQYVIETNSITADGLFLGLLNRISPRIWLNNSCS